MQNYPKVDIIIATYNESKYIEGCLDSILAQSYPSEKISIWVVDGISTDDTIEIVKSKFEEMKNCNMLINPKKIQSISWNIGISKSHGKIISIISAHSILNKDYIKNAVELLEKNVAQLVGGHMVATGSGFVGKTVALLHCSSFGIGVGKFHKLNYEGFADTVYTFNFKRSLIKVVGLFDKDLVRNQDIEFSSRVLKNKGKIYLSSSLDIIYNVRNSVNQFLKQYYLTGKWLVPTFLKSSNSLSYRHFLPAAFIIYIIILFLSLIIFSSSTTLIITLINSILIMIGIFYILLNLYYSFINGYSLGLSYIISLFTFHYLLHVIYGFGTFVGFISILISKFKCVKSV